MQSMFNFGSTPLEMSIGAKAAKIEFNPGKVTEPLARANKKIMRQIGAYIWKIASNSIKRSKNADKHSMPGTAPFYHGAKFGGSFNFKKSIQYASSDVDAIIGPIAGRLGALGALHEFGGMRMVKTIDPVAYAREIQVGEIGFVSTKKFNHSNMKNTGKRDPLTGFPVVAMEIRTEKMAEHATRLRRRIMRAEAKSKPAVYPARPFMGPALMKAQPYLSQFWENSI